MADVHDKRDPTTPQAPRDAAAISRSARGSFGHSLANISSWSSRAAGSSAAFVIATLTIAIWLLSGPLFHYSDTWQLVINTSTTIVTFLMVFLIQRSQNKESSAMQLKLNELIAAVQGASNHLIGVEDHSEDEIRTLREHYAELVELMRNDVDITKAHSVEEAQARHQRKADAGQPDTFTTFKPYCRLAPAGSYLNGPGGPDASAPRPADEPVPVRFSPVHRSCSAAR